MSLGAVIRSCDSHLALSITEENLGFSSDSFPYLAAVASHGVRGGILFLVALGYGLGSVYQRAGESDYLQFLVPGIMAQTVLFAAMFFGAMIMFDKQFGFLKETLVAPVSRLKIMVGGALGGATTAVLQELLVFIIFIALGFRAEHWLFSLLAIPILALLAIGIASFSSRIGSLVNDMQGFQAINQQLVFPPLLLKWRSLAPRPRPHLAALRRRVQLDVLRRRRLRDVMIGQTHFGLTKDLLVLGVSSILLIVFGAYRFRHIEA